MINFKQKKVVIIGSGFSGLATAAILAGRGFDVKVLEKNESYGGRASIFSEQGFNFDMGPSWYLMPEVFETFFQELETTVEKQYKLIRLDPSYRIFFGKKDVIDIKADLASNFELFEKIEKGSGIKLKQYLANAQLKYEASMRRFIYREYKSAFSLFNPALLTEKLNPLMLIQSLDDFIGQYFHNDKLKKILEYSSVFLGGEPKTTPALYSLMSHLDFNLGVWYPEGGIGSVTKAIYNLAIANGAKFHFNAEVNQILIANENRKIIKTKLEDFEAEIVVASADYNHVETKLLAKNLRTYPESYWQKKIMAPSAFILYLGLNKKLTSLSHHNLFLANNWQKHFNNIFHEPSWSDQPAYYVCCPSITDKTVAPANCENLFITVPLATSLDDNDVQRDLYAEFIIKDLEHNIGEKISPSIIVKRIFSQRDFNKRYNAYKGSALGLSQTLFQSTIFRPAHVSKKVPGLFYAGQYTNPGIGMAMSIISAQIVTKLIQDEIY